MITRKFGWTGADLPVIGQGTWKIDGDSKAEERAVEALRAGIELGLTHIDTAEMYGNGRAEELVAQAIAGVRDRIFLVSKVLPSNASYEGTLRACERTLRRLRTDYLDAYLLHWAGSHPIAETMRAMEKLAADGRIRYIGVSNLDVHEVEAAEHALRHHRLACNQVLYWLGDRGIERKLLPYCNAREIAVVAYSPFGQKPVRGKVLEEIARRNGRTPHQVVLNFLAAHGVFVIPKAATPEHVRDNAGAAGWELPPEDMAAIDRAFPAPDHDVPLGML